MNETASLHVISGVGGKGPACFLLEVAGKRLMLDLGRGPEPDQWPNLDDVGKVDALVLSHSHEDHIGGLSLLAKVGNPPVFTTDITARKLPAGTRVYPLPLRGRGDVLGIEVETGRNGHAPGGVWMRFHSGTGFLYTGDYSTESTLYAYDPPPKARTVLLDCSYGDDDTPLARRQEALRPHLARDMLLPAPADGRGIDIALYLAELGSTVRLDEATRGALAVLLRAARASIRDAAVDAMTALADDALPADAPSGATLATPADGSRGSSAALIARDEPRPETSIIFTGYFPAGSPADRLVQSRRAQFLRWNVHPRLSDTQALVRQTGAKLAVPAFCDRKYLPALTVALAPAAVTMDTVVPLG